MIYEELHLKPYIDGRQNKADLGAYNLFCNAQSPRQALGYLTSAEVFSGSSAPSDEQSTGRRLAPMRAVVKPGTGGPFT